LETILIKFNFFFQNFDFWLSSSLGGLKWAFEKHGYVLIGSSVWPPEGLQSWLNVFLGCYHSNFFERFFLSLARYGPDNWHKRSK